MIVRRGKEIAMGTEVMTESELAGLVGHRFPGGTYRVAHWENWLLTDCTGREPMPDGLVHPIILFHAPILGAGTSIGELFRLGRASGDGGSVGLVGYDWEYAEPIREEVEYRVEGGIVSAERRETATGDIDDHVAFSIELADGHTRVARVTNRWRFRRSGTGPPAGGTRAGDTGPDGAAAGGAVVPPWEMPSVDAARMKTMAAILRDPYPVHWDREANRRLGLDGRVINQGPLNLGYVANMLMAWAGADAVRRLTVSFGRPVLDGDSVIAEGRVREVVGGVAHCDVWLARAGERLVTGRAEVVAPPGV
jgi:acyl dehydratase